MHEVTYNFLKNEIKKIEIKYNFFSNEIIDNKSKQKLINQLNFLLHSLNKINLVKDLEYEKHFYFKEITNLLFLETEYLNKDLLEKPYYPNWRTIATKINWLIIEVNKIALDKNKINNDDIKKDEKIMLKWFRNAISHRERFSDKTNKKVFKNILIKIMGLNQEDSENYIKQKWVQMVLNNDDENKRMQFGRFVNIVIKPIGHLLEIENAHLSLEFIGYGINSINNIDEKIEKKIPFNMTFDTLSIFNLLSLINDILLDFYQKKYPEIFWK